MDCLRVAAVILGCSLGAGGLSGCEVRPFAASATARGSALDPPGGWVDETGAPTTLSSLAGQPFVLSAFFTSCTLRCPLTIEKLRAVDQAFRDRGAPVAVRLLTLDPTRDTPEHLRRFKQDRHLPEGWHFLRGSPEDTRALARTLGVHAAYDDAHIDHDVRIAVFDSRGQLARTFSSWSFDPSDAVPPL